MSDMAISYDGLRPIQTIFKGYRFRSRLEARWAVFLDTLGLRWEYEPQGFELRDGTRYLPDFYLPDQGAFVEIKPAVKMLQKRIYLAGKFSCGVKFVNAHGVNNWRELIAPLYSKMNQLNHNSRESELWANGFHRITGPWLAKPYDSDVEMMSPPSTHGNVSFYFGPQPLGRHIFDYCLETIRRSTTIFAWIDSLDCHGTLMELGYAMALNKEIIIAYHEDLDIPQHEIVDGYREHATIARHDLWFVEQAANKVVRSWSPRAAFDLTLGSPPKELQKVIQLDNWIAICGNPHPGEYRAFSSAINGYAPFCGCLSKIGNELFVDTGLCQEGEVEHALNSARSARFEHGEQP